MLLYKKMLLMTFGTTLVVRNWADQEKGHVYRKAKIYNRQIEKKNLNSFVYHYIAEQ